ncbi:hypothetical protein XcmpCFBP7700_10060 [Xanthomonas campestris]|uniref:N-acetylmuramoyl-L-alanine amidase n=1 Tax=Xanthomonas campestris TaxID=339 RepID=UPI000E7676A0|nr:N-acetylmuramoyl-L-alanine amidase [Xanthomonas campestris]RJU11495.1 hypothetical protein XcmpCFBP7700_10060 [Xanthomonas campestris]
MKRRDLLRTAGASLLLSPVLGYTQSLPVVQACDLQQEGALLRLRLQISTQVTYRRFTLADPARLVIDLAGVSTQAPRIGPLPDGTVVTAIRSGPHADGLRVVVDLARPVAAANARWDGTALLVDLAAAPIAATRSRLRPYVIAIDAGHGGKDPGAVSADARYEKHVAMAVAGRLHQRLAADLRYRPTMIRSDDRFVPLHERVMIAHRTRLHQDQVGQAGFAVLKSPDIPSLLVETGFMSNRDDCNRLCGDAHQDELAQTLHAGIDDYFQAFPGRA